MTACTCASVYPTAHPTVLLTIDVMDEIPKDSTCSSKDFKICQLTCKNRVII